MKIKMQPEEMTMITEVIEEYKGHDRELDQANEKLQQLVKEKDEIVNRIKITEIKERFLLSLLEQKYGPGTLDLKTFEYIRNDSVDSD